MGLLVCRAFGPTIQSVCGPGAIANARVVDVAFDQRKAKCEAARMVLQGLQTKVGWAQRLLENRQSPLSRRALELAAQLAGL